MFNRKYHTPGTAPATLVSRLPADTAPPRITLIEYTAASYEEKQVERFEELRQCRGNGKVSWINIDGLGDVELLRQLGEHFGLHPLALEDVLNTGQRPKIEEYPDHFFIVAQMIYSESGREVSAEQVSIFLTPDAVITIQEEGLHDLFEPIRQRLRLGGGFARKLKHDYLCYALLDAIVDHFFPVLEQIGDVIEEMEEELVGAPDRSYVGRLHTLKRSLLYMRRLAWPQREVLATLHRDETGTIEPAVKPFLRDCYDHTVQIMDMVESFRDLTTGMMDTYLSTLGFRTNEIMRVLTIVSVTFIPITFIAGFYGMNFENLPGASAPWGAVICLLAMIGIAVTMVAFFKKKQWM